ncbi:MAG: PepSY-associated TM helix domain-containing protein, partial [Pseudomonadales bacterium]
GAAEGSGPGERSEQDRGPGKAHVNPSLSANNEKGALPHPLHSGETFGLAGRIALALSGLLLPFLALTGYCRWRQKNRYRRRRPAIPS